MPKLLAYCDKNLPVGTQNDSFWHYGHYYFAQVKYRQGDKEWETYRDKMYRQLVDQAGSNGSWSQGYIGTVYTTSINLTILQLEKAALPIYQK